MSYSTELTELYYLMQRNQGQDLTSNGSLKAHLDEKAPNDFANAVFVYGYEVRDDTEIPYAYVKRAIGIIRELYESSKKDEIEKNDKMFVRYHLGLVGFYLANCQREDVSTEVIHSPQLEEIIDNLREVFRILETVEPRARGVLDYQTNLYYGYAYDCLSHLKVENGNRPIDLDSVYVFSDAVDDDEIWSELASQLRQKFPRGVDRHPEISYQEAAISEIFNVISSLEAKIVEEEEEEVVDAEEIDTREDSREV